MLHLIFARFSDGATLKQQKEVNHVPRVGDHVVIRGDRYKVYSVDWHISDATRPTLQQVVVVLDA